MDAKTFARVACCVVGLAVAAGCGGGDGERERASSTGFPDVRGLARNEAEFTLASHGRRWRIEGERGVHGGTPDLRRWEDEGIVGTQRLGADGVVELGGLGPAVDVPDHGLWPPSVLDVDPTGDPRVLRVRLDVQRCAPIDGLRTRIVGDVAFVAAVGPRPPRSCVDPELLRMEERTFEARFDAPAEHLPVLARHERLTRPRPTRGRPTAAPWGWAIPSADGRTIAIRYLGGNAHGDALARVEVRESADRVLTATPRENRTGFTTQEGVYRTALVRLRAPVGGRRLVGGGSHLLEP